MQVKTLPTAIRWSLTLSCLMFFCASCEFTVSSSFKGDGQVVSIADGDTFTLLTPENKQLKVRLYGIDCPERGQDFYAVAKQQLSDLIFQKPVRIEEKDKDRYGRTIAIVFDEKDRNINEAMLSEGMAWHYTQYDKNPGWSQLQEEARKARRGLWQQKGAQAPWEWRKERRAARSSQ